VQQAGFSCSSLVSFEPFQWIYTSVVNRYFIDTRYGLGRHLSDIPNYTTEEVNFNLLRILWVSDFFYAFACGLAKFSILALFWRLFNCSKPSKLAIQILFVLSLAWFTARVSSLSSQCYGSLLTNTAHPNLHPVPTCKGGVGFQDSTHPLYEQLAHISDHVWDTFCH
jgi:hypothetical protein